MLAHVVCFKMKGFAQGKTKAQNIIELKKRLENLQEEISVIRSLQVGMNEQGGEYEMVLVELFESEETLAIYDKHPAHIRIKEYIGEVCEYMTITDCPF